MNKTLLHGENAFKPVTTAPEGKVSKHTMYIAGHSETGHHHVLESKTEFEVIEPANMDANVFIRLLAPAKVVHQKTFDIHETKVLQTGIYEITHKTEYDPFAQVRRAVWD